MACLQLEQSQKKQKVKYIEWEGRHARDVESFSQKTAKSMPSKEETFFKLYSLFELSHGKANSR